MNQENNKKISLVEGLLMFFIVFFADLFEIALTLGEAIPYIGFVFPIVKGIEALTVWLGIQFWLIMKGIRGIWFLSGNILDIIANLLAIDIPFGKTAALLLTIYLANRPPKIIKVAEKVIPGKKSIAAAAKI
ncbi:MAG: hypothetical protein HY456_02835 [Parcubacteria group bacterium]|nr:hypothetical protein [Parcubacteria group bacterium]